MESLFIYTGPVTGKYFIGRKDNVRALAENLHNGDNTVIIAPHNEGKRSLIQQTLLRMKESGGVPVYVNLSFFNVRTLADAAIKLGSAVICNCAGSKAECKSLAESLLQNTAFAYSQSEHERTGRPLVALDDISDIDMESVISLPYRAAAALGIRLAVCIEEFQNILLTEDGERFCRIMNRVFGRISPEEKARACYIITGGEVNAMKYIFKQKHLMHKNVKPLQLSKVSVDVISDFCVRFFLSNGKVIDRDSMTRICTQLKGHLGHINHFCAICDGIAKGYIMEPLVREAFNVLVDEHTPVFLHTMGGLTTYQLFLLRAIIDGHKRFSSAEIIEKYHLNSSANVKRLKDALTKKEIITFDKDDNPQIIDPLFEYWIRHCFFEL